MTDARLTIPAWGASFHDVSLDSEVTLSGAVTLVVADLTIQGTVLSGGPAAGRSFYRIVAGAGGWGKSIPEKSYANDAGVKLSTILGDAASAASETLDGTTVPATTFAPSFVRPADLACRVLEQVSPNAWYVGEDGKTRIGARPTATLSTKVVQTSQLDLARGTVELASDSIANILPGAIIFGLTAVDIEHEIVKGVLRTRLWGKQGNGTSRRLAAWRALADQFDPDRKFRGTFEFRIVTQSGNRLNLQPIRVSTGMPNLQRVYVRPGVPGVTAQYALGSRVIVTFIDADPGRPAVVGFEDTDGAGFLPTMLQLAGAGGMPVARLGDQVTSFLPPTLAIVGSVTISGSPSPFTGTIAVANPITGTVTGGSAKVTCA